MSRFEILATDGVSDEGLAPLQVDDRFRIVKIDDSTASEFTEALRGASGLIVRSATKVTAEMMDGAPNLRVIGRAGVGVDNIDVPAATSRGIAVMNAPGGNTIAAAELTMALLLALARNVSKADQSIRAGQWERSAYQGVELRGRVLGVIGAGRIGGEVARRCRAFGMEVIAHDPFVTRERADELGLPLVGLDDVIEKADVITLHVPLNDTTRDMIDADALKRMKPGAFVINASRGGVVNETDLVDALERGRIAGAALDVYEEEPLPEGSPLRRAPHLVMTPHLGASTAEAQVAVATEVSAAMRAALAYGDLSPALNSAQIAQRSEGRSSVSDLGSDTESD